MLKYSLWFWENLECIRHYLIAFRFWVNSYQENMRASSSLFAWRLWTSLSSCLRIMSESSWCWPKWWHCTASCWFMRQFMTGMKYIRASSGTKALSILHLAKVETNHVNSSCRCTISSSKASIWTKWSFIQTRISWSSAPSSSWILLKQSVKSTK